MAVRTMSSNGAGALGRIERDMTRSVSLDEVQRVDLIAFDEARDPRGRLVHAQFGGALPFVPTRVYMISGVPAGAVRGGHAHRLCEQVLVCASGAVTVELHDGKVRSQVVLDDPTIGLHMKRLVWGVQSRFSAGAVLMVLASHAYDPEDYVRTEEEFALACQVEFA